MGKPCRVFCCYAHDDTKFLRVLRKHLMPLTHDQLITIQADSDIDPGSEWKREIDHYLDTAEIILLLVSPSFLASDHCSVEMRKALALHRQRSAHVIPIIIRPVDWRNLPLGELQSLPKDGKPVSTWQNTDKALLNIAEEIRMFVQKLPTNSRTNQEKEKPLMPPIQEDPLHAGGQDQHDKSTSKYNFSGSVHANVIGDGTHIDTITNIYGSDRNGIRSLEKGAKALWSKEYALAKKELRIAVEEIDPEEQKREAAKARYFQALAVLGEELPRHKGVVDREKVNKLLTTAIKLDPSCRTYSIALAVIETDVFESNALQVRAQDVSKWQARANSMSGIAYDEEVLPYLAHCQPRLYQQTWWVR